MANPNREQLNNFLAFGGKRNSKDMSDLQLPENLLRRQSSSSSHNSDKSKEDLRSHDDTYAIPTKEEYIDPHALLYGQYQREIRRWTTSSVGDVNKESGSTGLFSPPPAHPPARKNFRSNSLKDGKRLGAGPAKHDYAARKFLM